MTPTLRRGASLTALALPLTLAPLLATTPALAATTPDPRPLLLTDAALPGSTSTTAPLQRGPHTNTDCARYHYRDIPRGGVEADRQLTRQQRVAGGAVRATTLLESLVQAPTAADAQALFAASLRAAAACPTSTDVLGDGDAARVSAHRLLVRGADQAAALVITVRPVVGNPVELEADVVRVGRRVALVTVSQVQVTPVQGSAPRVDVIGRSSLAGFQRQATAAAVTRLVRAPR